MASATIAPSAPTPDINSSSAPRPEINRHVEPSPRRGGPIGSYSNREYRGGRGRGRGQRGGRGGTREQGPQSHPNTAIRPAPPTTTKQRPEQEVERGTRPTGGVEPKEASDEAKKSENQEDEGEAEVCFICASTVIHTSVAPCNHRTCHICALRLRALYKTRACAHCRTEAKYVIFTDDPVKRYEEFVDSDFQHTDDVLGIKYEQNEIFDDTRLLLRYNCPADDCDVACWGWPDLHRHVKGVHHKVLCDLCSRNKKVFTHEHELFTPQELKKHEKFGDDNPGAVDQSGFKGHPQCGFCVQRFYSDDELYTHCRDKHERCHICDRRNQGRQQQYYMDYNALEEHFRTDHFLCADQDCLDKKFVVFESEMDLKAHQLEVHPNGLSKDARRDARRVDISGFDYRAPHQEPRMSRRDREGRGTGRGRDPNAEPLPASTAQPMRRDEIAYQRQMALSNAQNPTPRGSNNQTAPTQAYAARPTGRTQETITAPRQAISSPVLMTSTPNLQNTPGSQLFPSSTTQEAQTPQEQARQLQHAAVISRASNMLQNDDSKTSDFRTSVSSYRNSKITAQQLIDTFFTIFDVPPSDLGKLVKELAEIYENEGKRAGLLKAWNDWRAINEDYPSLPGPSGVLAESGASTTGGGGKRVLRLKSSTAQSSRSAVSKQGSWGKGIVNTSSNPFPSLATAGAGITGSSRSGNAPAWVSTPAGAHTSRPASSSTNHAFRPNPPTSNTARSSITGPSSSSADAFPALPAAAKPNTLMMGLTRGTVRWDDNNNSSSNKRNSTNTTGTRPWGNPTNPASTTGVTGGGGQEPNVEGADDGATATGAGGAGKKKGKQGKKQTLYHFG